MSDFGRGYATCLRQFANHRRRLGETEALYRKMAAQYPGEFTDAGAGIWANGASDHLYDLIRPRKGVPIAEWRQAKLLQDRALDIGHGFRPSSKSDPAECYTLLDMADSLLNLLLDRGYPVGTLDAAMATDEQLGLRPDRGSWACPEDIARRKLT